MDARRSRGWRSYVQPWGGGAWRGRAPLEYGRGGGGGSCAAPTPSLGLRSHPPPQGQALPHGDSALPPPHYPLPCSHHITCILNQPTWANPVARGSVSPAPSLQIQATCSPAPFFARPSSRCGALSKSPFSDLATYRYVLHPPSGTPRGSIYSGASLVPHTRLAAVPRPQFPAQELPGA